MILGLYLEILHRFSPIFEPEMTGSWILGSMIAVAITEYILRGKRTTSQKQAE